MRTLGFRTHVVLAVAAAAGILLALGRPWYAPAPRAPAGPVDVADVGGPLLGLADGIRRSLTDRAGVTGWEALGGSGTALALLAAVGAAGALACLAPGLQPLGRGVARAAALATAGVAAWRLVDPPGGAATELRHGALLCAVCALVLLSAASSVAAAPSRRRRPGWTATAGV